MKNKTFIKPIAPKMSNIGINLILDKLKYFYERNFVFLSDIYKDFGEAWLILENFQKFISKSQYEFFDSLRQVTFARTDIIFRP